MNEVRVYNRNTKEVSYHKIEIDKTISKNNGNILWKLTLYKTDENLIISNENYFLFNALEEIRLELEKNDKLIVVRGADIDCGFSGMQADMSAGASISKLEMHDKLNNGENINPKDYTFHILDDTKIENVTTVKLQKEFYEKWVTGKLNPKNTKTNMKTIWKYELKMETLQEIEIPIKSKILSVNVIKNIGYLWVQIDKDNITKKEKIKILTIPTGTDFQEEGEYIGTLLYKQGEIIQHLFKYYG